MHFRIATYNIHRCIGGDGIENRERIALVLREIDADIVALQEVTAHPDGRPDDMLAYLAASTAMVPVEGFTMTVEGARYGNALLSRIPLSAVKRINISVEGREPRGVIESVFIHGSHSLTLWATHLGLRGRERNIQIQKIMKKINSAEADVSILLGDFNEWLAWGRSFRAIRRLFKVTPSPASFPSHRPLLKLDRIWISPSDKLSTVKVHSTILSRIASDHLPLVAEVIL